MARRICPQAMDKIHSGVPEYRDSIRIPDAGARAGFHPWRREMAGFFSEALGDTGERKMFFQSAGRLLRRSEFHFDFTLAVAANVAMLIGAYFVVTTFRTSLPEMPDRPSLGRSAAPAAAPAETQPARTPTTRTAPVNSFPDRLRLADSMINSNVAHTVTGYAEARHRQGISSRHLPPHSSGVASGNIARRVD